MNEEKLEIRKHKIYGLICDELYVPMKIKEIAALLNIPREERSELDEVLSALIADGKVEVTPKGKYIKLEAKNIVGTLIKNQRGFGFVEQGEGKADIFIAEGNLLGAMHGDTVQAVLIAQKSGKRQEGTIVKIIKRGVTQLVGNYQNSGNFGFVKPDNQRFSEDIYIALEHTKGAVTGHKVVVELTHYGKADKKPEGKIIEIIGHINDPGTDIAGIIKGYGLPVEFSQKVLNQVERVTKPVSDADMEGRMDLRDWQTVTIDGEDAKDLDDAITISREGEQYRLGVHIADVTNYVQENSALDAEAIERGTSVYLVDRVIPMLPHALSNGICSLNAGEDRLALSCIMVIDKKGNVIDHQIVESVVRIDCRMTYTIVKEILEDKQPETRENYIEYEAMFQLMEELALVLREKRKKRGSIDFDFPETKILLDEQGKPIEIKPYERNAATRIIEDFMLIANETVAQDYYWQEIPFVYRTHETPEPEKIAKLSTFINNFGYALKIGQDEVHPKELQKLLASIEGSAQEALISRLTLRSMKQAKYSTISMGHFGLATSYYCHFTSPIRRYPDLQIHRIIKENLRGRMNDKRLEHYENKLPNIAVHASKMERRAEEAEREVEKMKKAEYMEERIGEQFDGVISGITNWGFYVELPNTIEGMVSVANLKGDFFNYSEETYELVGEATNIRYKLGQQVKVVVNKVDRFMRTIDFVLAEVENG